MLTHWSPTTSILVPKEKVSGETFKCIYLKSPNFWSIFYSISGISLTFTTFWKKRWASEVKYFWNYLLGKTCLLNCLKDFVSGHPRANNMLTRPKLCWNLPTALFCDCFIDLGDIEAQNIPLGEIWSLRTLS